MSISPRPTESDEVHDLQLVLSAGFITAVVLGLMALLSGLYNVLAIPTGETLVLAGVAAVVAGLGWIGLRAHWPFERVAWSTLTAYALIITVAVHLTGGPQTPMPALYPLVVIAASFVLGQSGAYAIAALGIASYGILLALEYAGIVPIIYIWRTPFDARSKDILLLVNWLTVATPTMITAYLGGTLAVRLKMRNQQLKDSEELRENLVQMLVHDLRNPLTALLGGLDIINLMLNKMMNDDQRRLLDNARHSGHMLLAMVGDMLDVTKMEAGQLALKPQPLNLESMLADAIGQVYALAEMEGLMIELEPVAMLPPVQGDRQLIQRVIANLLSNAIKHTPPGGTITLSARRYHEHYVAVGIRDTGEGIPAAQQDKIFEKFGQVEKGGLYRRGTGLGLTLCKMAIEAHQGRIWVESEPNKGSTFSFTLPITPGEGAARLTPPPVQPAPAGDKP